MASGLHLGGRCNQLDLVMHSAREIVAPGLALLTFSAGQPFMNRGFV